MYTKIIEMFNNNVCQRKMGKYLDTKDMGIKGYG